MLIALAFNLSVTPKPNIASALYELDLLTSDLGQLALSSSLLNDVFIWIFLGLAAVERKNNMTTSFAAFLFVCRGPILFGSIIPTGPPLGSTLAEKVELVTTELIMPFFYMQMGAEVNLFSLLEWKSFAVFEFMVVMAYIAKFLGALLSSLFNELALCDSLKLGFFVSIRGIIDFVAYWDIRSQKMLTAESHAAWGMSAVAETLVATPLIKIAYKHAQNRADELDKSYARSLQRTLPESELRILSCIYNADDVPGIITLLEASNPAVGSPICAYVIHLIQLVSQAAPLLTFHKHHRRLARDRQIPLMLIPFSAKGLRGGKGSAFNNIIAKIQKFAPCTVGVLFTEVHISIGPMAKDDREALAYGIRMLGHPKVTVTLLHISFKEGTNDELQRAVDEFRLRTRNNRRASYHRMVVDNWEQAIKSSRSSIDSYNLVIIGRCQGTTSGVEQEIASWIESPELGIMGDMLASLDDSKQISILVVQHCGNFDATTLTSRIQVEESNHQKLFSIISYASESKERKDFV
ncbi:hypothetical protein Ancab_034536 [Ancistrocladus abbreviatus]